MLVNDKDALSRLSSPLNLMNRLRRESPSRNKAMSLFIPSKKDEKPSEEVTVTFNPFIKKVESQTSQKVSQPQPVLNDLLENTDSQIKLGLAHDNAIKLLNQSIDALASKLDDVKADKLPSVIAAASKTVESIRRERNEANKNNKDREVHYHFYTPEQKKVTDYAIIDVGGV